MTSPRRARDTPDCSQVDRIDTSEPVSYPVHFGDHVLTARLPAMTAGRKVLVVTTPTVHAKFAETLIEASHGNLSEANFLVLDCTEATKDMRQVERVCVRAADGLDRDGLIVGFGGGVVTEIACFAAAMIRRGVSHAKIPTTLVGQIDAGIGVKGGVNFGSRKSFLGCFRAPEDVLIRPGFLATLPSRHLSAGLAEMIKMAIIADAELLDMLDRSAESLLGSGFTSPEAVARETLVRSIRLMLAELRPNLVETASRERKVDFGHTFSPRLEAVLDFSIPHGFAVAIDIALSSAIALHRGMLSENALKRVVSCILKSRLPLWHEAMTPELCAAALDDAARHRGGHTNLIVPRGIGSTATLRNASDVGASLLERALDHVRSLSETPAPSHTG